MAFYMTYVVIFIACLLVSLPNVSTAADGVDTEEHTQTAETEQATEPIPYTLDYVGNLASHKAAYEDTLVNVSRGYGLGFVELRAANPGIDPWLPGKGTKIKLPTRHLLPDAPREGIVINLPEMRLYAFADPSEPPLTFPIGVGRVGLDTPLGNTTVRSKTVAPKWRPTKRMRDEDPDLPDVVGPGPENPLGTHALYLGWPEYAIHGTNKPYGIGRRVSSGCIRLYPENIKELYYATPVGTQVTVVNQPVKLAWINHELFLEAHATLEQADRVEKIGGFPQYEISEDDLKLILETAGDFKEALDWLTIRKTIRERSGMPTVIGTRPEVLSVKTVQKDDASNIDVSEDTNIATDKPEPETIPETTDTSAEPAPEKTQTKRKTKYNS